MLLLLFDDSLTINSSVHFYVQYIALQLVYRSAVCIKYKTKKKKVLKKKIWFRTTSEMSHGQ